MAFWITRIGCIQLQHESSLIHKCFEKCIDDGFEEILVTRTDFPTKYDNVLRLSNFESFGVKRWSLGYLKMVQLQKALHLSLPTEKIMLIVDQLDFYLLHSVEGYNNMNFLDPISFSGSLTKAFETLSKHFRLIEDIPLQVSTVHALDSDIFHLLK